MPQSFAAAYLHYVFSTKNREPWFDPNWADRLFTSAASRTGTSSGS
jgi:hypothetical protein